MRAPSTPRSPDAASGTSAARTSGCPADELAGAHGRHPRQRPHDLSRGRLRDRRRRRSRSAARGRRDRPRLPDRRHADRAGAGDPRGHRRSSSSRTSARSSATRACCAARSTRSSTTPRARRGSASTASTCSPTATTATSTRSSRPSSGRPRCRSSAPARSTPPSASSALASRGVWAFTIGTAALDGVLVEGAPLERAAARRARRRLSGRVGVGARWPTTPRHVSTGIDALVDHAADDVVLLAVGRLDVERVAEPPIDHAEIGDRARSDRRSRSCRRARRCS